MSQVSAGEVAVGSGRVRTAHGELPVPVPAVARLAVGWRVRSGGEGELATPTGMALIRALSETCEDLPAMTVTGGGVGAGTKDFPGRANIVRVLLGTDAFPEPPMVLLAANVDDLDPRLWPGVLAGLLDAGAADAWLTPILMKKGRPAHTLTMLCPAAQAAALRKAIFTSTSTLGVRESPVDRYALDRCFRSVQLEDGTVRIKIGHTDGVIVQAMPEFADVAALAHTTGLAERVVLQQAHAAAAAAGWTIGEKLT